MSAPLLETTSLALLHTRDVNKNLTPKDQDKDKDLTPKDQDKDKDLTPKASFESHGRFPKEHWNKVPLENNINYRFKCNKLSKFVVVPDCFRTGKHSKSFV